MNTLEEALAIEIENRRTATEFDVRERFSRTFGESLLPFCTIDHEQVTIGGITLKFYGVSFVIDDPTTDTGRRVVCNARELRDHIEAAKPKS